MGCTKKETKKEEWLRNAAKKVPAVLDMLSLAPPFPVFQANKVDNAEAMRLFNGTSKNYPMCFALLLHVITEVSKKKDLDQEKLKRAGCLLGLRALTVEGLTAKLIHLEKV